MANSGATPKKNCWVNGLHKIFASDYDLRNCIVTNEYKDVVNVYTTIYAVCDSTDESIFGPSYKEGAKVIVVNKTVFFGTETTTNVEKFFGLPEALPDYSEFVTPAEVITELESIMGVVDSDAISDNLLPTYVDIPETYQGQEGMRRYHDDGTDEFIPSNQEQEQQEENE